MLEGAPSIVYDTSADHAQLQELAREVYLLPPLNHTHIKQSISPYGRQQQQQTPMHVYVFPGSVKHMHPEFDSAIAVLLRTDPYAFVSVRCLQLIYCMCADLKNVMQVILAVVRSGRDRLPPAHMAVRHDLMHPTMPTAAAAKLRNRLVASMGEEIAE
jgi:hypothetical protein